MNPAPDDPRLTAYVLGECPPDEAAEFARAIAADPALGIAAREIESVERMLATTFAAGEDVLSPRQRNTILAAARAADVSPVTRLQSRPRIARWLAPLSAAALILLGIILFVPEETPTGNVGTASNPENPPIPVSMLPAPGPVDASETRGGGASSASVPVPPPATGHPVLRPRGPVSAAHHPLLPLPIQSGRASYGWITESIREQGRLPPADAVRTEEILNHFRVRPVGATAIHQGITLTVETLPCPWKPSATLAVVAIRGARESAHTATATWHADASAVWRYRLIGHASPVGVAPRPLARTLAAAAEHVLVLEIEASSPMQRGFGSIEWTVDGEPAPSLAIAYNPSRTPSTDARFATFVCALAEWLRAHSDDGSRIDAEVVSTIMSEVEADPPAPDRAKFLQLARKALEIAADE